MSPENESKLADAPVPAEVELEVDPTAVVATSPAAPEAAPPAKPKVHSDPITRLLSFRALPASALKGLSAADRAAYEQEKSHHDQWGHLPPAHRELVRGLKLPDKAVENHAKRAGTHMVEFAAARAYHQWPVGKEMEAADYEAAVKKVLGERFGF